MASSGGGGGGGAEKSTGALLEDIEARAFDSVFVLEPTATSTTTAASSGGGAGAAAAAGGSKELRSEAECEQLRREISALIDQAQARMMAEEDAKWATLRDKWATLRDGHFWGGMALLYYPRLDSPLQRTPDWPTRLSRRQRRWPP